MLIIKPLIVSIEGNIGSGKSTLLEHLRLRYTSRSNEIVFVREPVDLWESIHDSSGKTMLQKFYEDQNKYAFSFQMMAYISRLSLLKETIEANPQAKVIITERSLYTDKFVFAKMLFDTNKIEDVNYCIYSKWFDFFAKEFPILHYVYVKTSPTVCMTRIGKRSRNGEGFIPLDYLESCHKYHESMIESFQGSHHLCCLDGDVDIYEKENANAMVKWLDEFDSFISEHRC